MNKILWVNFVICLSPWHQCLYHIFFHHMEHCVLRMCTKYLHIFHIMLVIIGITLLNLPCWLHNTVAHCVYYKIILISPVLYLPDVTRDTKIDMTFWNWHCTTRLFAGELLYTSNDVIVFTLTKQNLCHCVSAVLGTKDKWTRCSSLYWVRANSPDTVLYM